MNNNKDIHLSPLSHTWILDLDGTLVEHNGYKLYGEDRLLPGATDFINKIPNNDMIILLTSRTENERKLTQDFLSKHSIRYNHIIFNAPFGERILINDNKPSGLIMSLALSTERNQSLNSNIIIEESW